MRVLTVRITGEKNKWRSGLIPVLIIATLFLFFISFGKIALSAEISVYQKPLPISACSVEIRGPIESGDYELFKKALIKLNWFDPLKNTIPYDTRGRILCLNSPGGTFLDGIQISKLVRLTGIATYVPDLAKCFSACALIFMSGNTILEEGGEGYHNRTLHIGGRLGFHAPYYKAKKFEKFDKQAVMDLLNIYRLFVAELIAQARVITPNSVFPSTPTSLLEELMKAGPDQMVEVDTIEEIGRWNISITGLRKIDWSKTKASMQQLCINWSSWIFDKKSRVFLFNPETPNLSVSQIDLSRYPDYQRETLEKLKIYRHVYWEYIPAYCDMAVLNKDKVFLSLVDTQRGVEFPWWSIPKYLALPPNTPLKKLAP